MSTTATTARTTTPMRPAPSPSTTTTILENPTQQQQLQTLTLRLNRLKKKVSWKEGTVDNEFMQRKSSKICCIFHKEKPFDEDDSDDDDCSHDHPDHDHEHKSDGACSSSKHNEKEAVVSDPRKFVACLLAFDVDTVKELESAWDGQEELVRSDIQRICLLEKPSSRTKLCCLFRGLSSIA
ncbi:unnamed protein product [Dovyalis caffra]|uniref:Uncharacterized protein n=1 Tax=Dovyalis caffra TaxID=77055 RepID=A0AAV1SQG0_9ROSI|nr:unnamed protein product [Dovyalis caffra]